MDDNRSRTLDLAEFKFGLRDYGSGLTDSEIQALFQYIDKDGSGTLDFDEFLKKVRVSKVIFCVYVKVLVRAPSVKLKNNSVL